jgi:hypothetical protein
MGGFEIILVIIGVAWTIASGVMQKKAKAAKAARLKALANETSSPASPSIPIEPIPERATSSPLQERLAQLRDQITEAMVPEQPARSSRSQPGAATARTTGPAVKVPRPPAAPIQTREGQSILPNYSVAEEAPAVDPQPSSTPITAAELRGLMHDPRRIREAIVLNELLGPPLALRG